jgi:hypothetical protein
MSRYSYIYSSIWEDSGFMALTAPEKVLFLYFLSSPHSNMVGYYRLPIGYIVEDLKWSDKQIRQNLTALKNSGMVLYDEENGVVFVRNFLKYNEISNAKQGKGAIKQIKDVRVSPLLHELKKAWMEYVKGMDTLSDSLICYIDTLSIPYQCPTDTPPRNSGYPIDEQVQVQVQVTGTETGTENIRPSPKMSDVGKSPPKKTLTPWKKSDPLPETATVEWLRDAWNEILPECGIPRVREITDQRRDHFNKRLKENPERGKTDYWLEVFEKITKSDFLSGRVSPRDGRKRFICRFAWLLERKEALAKITEGFYDNDNAGRVSEWIEVSDDDDYDPFEMQQEPYKGW